MEHSPLRPFRASSNRLRVIAAFGFCLSLAACNPDALPVAPTDLGRAANVESDGSIPVLVGFTTAPGAAQIALIENLGGRVSHRYKYIPVVAAAIPASVRDVLATAAGVKYVE